MSSLSAPDVIRFWFEEIDTSSWWKKDLEFDQEIAQRFAPLLQQAASGELYTWRDTAPGLLAEILILDQFSRNAYRDTAQAFANDAQALCLAQFAIAQGLDIQLDVEQRTFLYMPFMHSESAVIHELAVPLFESLGRPRNLEFELRHKSIIDHFGRYPHRNSILGRTSTAEEIEFLKLPGSGF